MIINRKVAANIINEMKPLNSFDFTSENYNDKVPNHLLKMDSEDKIIVFIPKRIGNKDLTILNLFSLFGVREINGLPCFYNQDWYMNEEFASQPVTDPRWIVIDKNICEKSRGYQPDKESIKDILSAVEYTYIFIITYLINQEILWKYDYIWTSDFDSHGDQIYVGRYLDKTGKTQNGFSVHRHLSIKNNYGILNSN